MSDDFNMSDMEEVIRDIQHGKPVIVMDDESRENEGDLILAANHATPETIAFFIRHTSGVLCAPMTAKHAKKLGLPPMVQKNQCPTGTAYTVSCDAKKDTTTGISAEDRSRTFLALSSSSTKAEDLIRPGHVFPLVAREGGVLERRGHTETAVDLCRLAGIFPAVGAIAELTNDDGTMMRLDDCVKFARQHKLHIITVESLVNYLSSNQSHKRKVSYEEKETKKSKKSTEEDIVSFVCECTLPVERDGEFLGEWTLKMFSSTLESGHIVALVKGDVHGAENVITRVHSGCFTGNILGSMRCDCNDQLTQALKLVHQHGRGIVLYFEGHEGRGIGLEAKIKAYQLQTTQKLNTYQANEALGYPADMRAYEASRGILKLLGVKSIELLTNNAHKIAALEDITVKVTPLLMKPNVHNKDYLETKSQRERQLLVEHSENVFTTSLAEKIKLNSQSIAESVVEHRTQQTSDILAILQGGCSIESKHAKEMPLLVPSGIDASKLRIGVVHTLWNESLIKPMTDGALKAISGCGVLQQNVVVLSVPGSFELPYACQKLAKSGAVDVVLALGVLIKGETAHFEYISSATSQGLMDVGLKTDIPVLYGVLNCYTYQHAVDRCLPPSELPTSLGLSAVRMAALNCNMIKE